MKIVLDTNVFVSGIFWQGPPYQILKAWRDRHLQLVFSPEILDEYRRVLDELGSRYSQTEAVNFLDLLTLEAECCDPFILKGPVSRDPDDDKFIACALACKAFCLVSGDKDLLAISECQGVQILKPRDFVRKYLHSKH